MKVKVGLKLHSLFSYLLLLSSQIIIVIFRILDTPFFDILVLLLLVRIFFPRFFGAGKKEQPHEKSRIFVRSNSKQKSPDQNKDEGEYIEYEEIK
jgi:hypothetical protein